LRVAPEQKKEFEGPEILVKPRNSARFGLLAACVAIAASFGAVAGSLSVAKLQPMFAAAPPPPAPVQPAQPAQKDNVADEMKALKDTVTQLRTATRTLSEQVASLKTSVSSSNNAQNAQITKLSETIDRVEKSQAEQRRAATTSTTAAVAQRQAAADVTGSIAAKSQAQPSQQDAQAALRQHVVQGWVLRRVYDGAALIEGRDGIIEVEPGEIAPGLGRIEGIRRQDGRWVVVTSRGLVVGR